MCKATEVLYTDTRCLQLSYAYNITSVQWWWQLAEVQLYKTFYGHHIGRLVLAGIGALKMQNAKMMDKLARCEIVGRENAGCKNQLINNSINLKNQDEKLQDYKLLNVSYLNEPIKITSKIGNFAN